jgi:hypothetical protein
MGMGQWFAGFNTAFCFGKAVAELTHEKYN